MKHFITWHAFDGYVQQLTQHIKQSMGTDLHDIVCVSRGGLVLAAALSYALNIKNVHCVGVRSYTVHNDQQDMQVYQHLNLDDLKHRVLVVDDVSDTGNTFLHLQKLLINKQVITASLATKCNTKFVPDHSALQLDSSIWIVFPWDK